MTWVTEIRWRLYRRLPEGLFATALVNVAMTLTMERDTPEETEAACWAKIQDFLKEATR